MTRISRSAAKSVIVGAVLYLALEVVLHVLRRDYNPARRFLSEYAVGQLAILGTVAFCLLAGTTVALTVTLLIEVRGSCLLNVTCALLFLVGIGFCALALFPTDLSDPRGGPPPIRTAIGVVHDVSTSVLSAALCVAALMLPFAYKRDLRWRAISSRILGFGVFIPFFLCIASVLPWQWCGVGQRLVVISGLVWMIANCHALLHSGQSNSRNSSGSQSHSIASSRSTAGALGCPDR
jgi:hypothetical protein